MSKDYTSRKKTRGAATLELRARNKHLQALGLWWVYQEYTFQDARSGETSTDEILVLARKHSKQAFLETQGVLLMNGKSPKDRTIDQLVNYRFKKGFKHGELPMAHRKCAIRHHRRLEDLRMVEVPGYVRLSTRVPANINLVAEDRGTDRGTGESLHMGPVFCMDKLATALDEDDKENK